MWLVKYCIVLYYCTASVYFYLLIPLYMEFTALSTSIIYEKIMKRTNQIKRKTEFISKQNIITFKGIISTTGSQQSGVYANG